MGERVDLLGEVKLINRDIGFAVEEISLSEVLPQASHIVYINIKTKENKRFTIRLTIEGFRVVGHDFDLDQENSTQHPSAFETIYSLLQEISPSYVNLFGNALSEKLTVLKAQEEKSSQ